MRIFSLISLFNERFLSLTPEIDRHLRRNSSYVEKCVWNWLRRRRYFGYKFRRQHQIGPYIVDFFCHDRKLVIELDGPHHKEQKDYDKRRDTWLENQGMKVLRFWNDDLQANEDVVFKKIQAALETRIDTLT